PRVAWNLREGDMGTMCERAGAGGSTRRKLVLFAAAALTVAVPGFAHAGSVGVLPTSFGATYFNAVDAVDPYPYQGEQPYAAQSTQQPTGGLEVTGSTYFANTFYTATTDNDYNIPSLAASVRAVGNVKADAGSGLYYYIEFATLPGGPSTISRRVQGTVSATIGETQADAYPDEPSHNFASALFYIYDGKGNGDLVSQAANVDLRANPLGSTQTVQFDQFITFQTNLVYEIVMTASAVADYDHLASAFSDPYIDLSDLPNGVTFLESAGIGNSLPGATPLPAALPLFGSGLAALGVVGWRRK